MKSSKVQLEFVDETPKTYDELNEAMDQCFADTFVFYLKAHGYHWNVEGPNFGPFHTFFEIIYNEVYETIDKMAEEIRALGHPALFRLPELQRYRSIPDVPFISTDPLRMVQDLYESNMTLIAKLNVAQDLAEKAGKRGLASYLEDRVDSHEKHGWMLRSFLK